jgi:hypothetical protein
MCPLRIHVRNKEAGRRAYVSDEIGERGGFWREAENGKVIKGGDKMDTGEELLLQAQGGRGVKSEAVKSQVVERPPEGCSQRPSIRGGSGRETCM